ncbi:MAG: Crp/Fnr family transcriptional regulator [Alphaproteobacteria bacterium]|nr:Crp/Fnr family transcriptional regulator [Alphaproteobacteria bacterium]
MSLNDEVEALKRIKLFSAIEPAKLKLLAFASERISFEAGQSLFREGDPGDAAYLVLEGVADVVVQSSKGPITVAEIGRDAFVGEIAILCDVPRTASVTAASRIVALRIRKDVFLQLLRDMTSMALEIMRELAERLEATT